MKRTTFAAACVLCPALLLAACAPQGAASASAFGDRPPMDESISASSADALPAEDGSILLAEGAVTLTLSADSLPPPGEASSDASGLAERDSSISYTITNTSGLELGDASSEGDSPFRLRSRRGVSDEEPGRSSPSSTWAEPLPDSGFCTCRASWRKSCKASSRAEAWASSGIRAKPWASPTMPCCWAFSNGIMVVGSTIAPPLPRIVDRVRAEYRCHARFRVGIRVPLPGKTNKEQQGAPDYCNR